MNNIQNIYQNCTCSVIDKIFWIVLVICIAAVLIAVCLFASRIVESINNTKKEIHESELELQRQKFFFSQLMDDKNKITSIKFTKKEGEKEVCNDDYSINR